MAMVTAADKMSGGDLPDRSLADVRLLSPLERPGKYSAIGMNYQKHLEEVEKTGVAAPKQQFWFNK